MALIVDFKPAAAAADNLQRRLAKETKTTSDIGDVLHRMRKTALALLSAEIQLAKNELQEEFTAEVLFTRRVILASALIVVGASLFLFGVLILLAKFIPLWLCAITCGGALATGGVITLMTAWKRHASISSIAHQLKENFEL